MKMNSKTKAKSLIFHNFIIPHYWYLLNTASHWQLPSMLSCSLIFLIFLYSCILHFPCLERAPCFTLAFFLRSLLDDIAWSDLGGGPGSRGHAACCGSFSISFSGLRVLLSLASWHSINTLWTHQLLNSLVTCNCLNATLSCGDLLFFFVPPSSGLGLWSLIVLGYFFLYLSLVSRLWQSGAIWTLGEASLLPAEALGLRHVAMKDCTTDLGELFVQPWWPRTLSLGLWVNPGNMNSVMVWNCVCRLGIGAGAFLDLGGRCSGLSCVYCSLDIIGTRWWVGIRLELVLCAEANLVQTSSELLHAGIVLSKFWASFWLPQALVCLFLNDGGGSFTAELVLSSVGLVVAWAQVGVVVLLGLFTDLEGFGIASKVAEMAIILAWLWAVLFLLSVTSRLLDCGSLAVWLSKFRVSIILAWIRIGVNFEFVFPSEVDSLHAWSKCSQVCITCLWSWLWGLLVRPGFLDHSCLAPWQSASHGLILLVVTGSQAWVVLGLLLLSDSERFSAVTELLERTIVLTGVWKRLCWSLICGDLLSDDGGLWPCLQQCCIWIVFSWWRICINLELILPAKINSF